MECVKLEIGLFSAGTSKSDTNNFLQSCVALGDSSLEFLSSGNTQFR
jgi:hypothetical protein